MIKAQGKVKAGFIDNRKSCRRGLFVGRLTSAIIIAVFLLSWAARGNCRNLPSEPSLAISSEAIALSVNKAAVSVEDLNERAREIGGDQELAEETKKAALELYQKSIAFARKRDRYITEAIKFAEAVNLQDPGELKKLKEEVRAAAVFNPAPARAAADKMGLAEIKTRVDKVTVEFQDLEANLEEKQDELKLLRSRRDEIDGEQKPISIQLKGIREEPPEAPVSGAAPSVLAEARRLNRGLQRQALSAQLKALQQERVSLPARIDRSGAELDLMSARKKSAEKRLEVWREIFSTRRNEYSRRRVEEAEKVRDRSVTEEWPPLFRDLAGQNVELAGELGVVNDKARQVEGNIARLKERLKQIKETYGKTRKRVDSMGLTPVVGALLQKRRRELVKLELPRRSKENRRAEMRHVNEEELHLDVLKEEVAALDSEAIVGHLAALKLGPGEQDMVRAKIEEMLQDGHGLINDLTIAYSQYLTLLGDESYAERALRLEAGEFVGFINVNLLWARSNQAFGLADVMFLDVSARRFLNPENWISLGKNLILSLKRDWLRWGLLLIVLVGWLLFYLRRPGFIKTLSREVGRVKSDSIMITLKKLGVAILTAGIVPLLIYFAGRLMAEVPGCDEFTRAICLGLSAGARVLFFAWLAGEILRPDGLGEIHFGWPRDTVRSVRSFARWSMILIAPLVFLVTLINAGLSAPVRGSLGRILFILEMVVLAVILGRLFRPHGLIFASLEHRAGARFLAKTRRVGLSLSIIIPGVLVIIVFLGYYRSGVLLGRDLIATIALAGALILLKAFLVRWDRIVRCRLEREEEASPEKVSSPGENGGPGEIPDAAPPDKAGAESETMSIQISILIRVAITVLALLGLWGIWSTDLQILEFLDRVVLWTYQAGIDAAQQPLMKSTTLGNLIQCFLILGFTLLIIKKLSGVLETVILKRFGIAPGSRHAFTLITRYVVIILGLTLALNSIGIGWAKFQWLLAALTVGFGFGLKDIVANFISGIIILFERPIRLGDIITIKGVSGRITGIRIRATTITDWDRKEVIIPNQYFLTSEIVNWSLSDQLVRAVIPVGVAYGSDARKTEEALLEIARKHPLVMDDPSPSVVFNNFGDSSLDFALRVFVQIKDRTTVINQLHQAINERFNQEGLEMPFPQHDAHLDTLKPLDIRIVQGETEKGLGAHIE